MQTTDQILSQLTQTLQAADLYYGHGTTDAAQEAYWIIVSILGINPYTDQPGQSIQPSDWQAMQALAEQRIQTRQPLAYLINEAWFCGLKFFVDERVLIPRSPIGELISLNFQPWLQSAPQRILELCTGSGCIAIALAYQFPQAQIVATDIDADALAVAAYNIQQHGLNNIQLVQADLFNPLSDSPYEPDALSGQFDLIVTNPPYVDAQDMQQLPVEYRHEPELALAAGQDGLSLVLPLLGAAGHYLTEQAGLVLEVGNSAEALQAAVPDLPMVWLDFEQGGQGVCWIDAHSLKNLQQFQESEKQ